MAALLIDSGAAIDKARDCGETPLSVAVEVSIDHVERLGAFIWSSVVDVLRWLDSKTV